jgi:hypothetical protein
LDGGGYSPYLRAWIETIGGNQLRKLILILVLAIPAFAENPYTTDNKVNGRFWLKAATEHEKTLYVSAFYDALWVWPVGEIVRDSKVLPDKGHRVGDVVKNLDFMYKRAGDKGLDIPVCQMMILLIAGGYTVGEMK